MDDVIDRHEWITAGEASDLAGVERHVIYMRAKSRRWPTQSIGATVLYRRADVLSWRPLQLGRPPGPKPAP